MVLNASWAGGMEPEHSVPPSRRVVSRDGNLLAPQDSIRFRFRGQRFDSKTIIDATFFLMQDFLKYTYTSEFATQSLLITSYLRDDH